MIGRPPIRDPDGRWWFWKPGTGYLPETYQQRNRRQLELRGIREQKTRTRSVIRKRLWELGEGLCLICVRPIAREDLVTLDHVVPKSQGGKEAGNFLPAHVKCNNRKGDRSPTGCELIWLEVINARARAKGLRWGS